MKKKLTYIFLVAFFACNKISYAQQPFLTIYYYYGEKSRDSHSSTENISINGSTVSYSVKYSGRKGPNQKDEEKTCSLTKEQLEKINKTIRDKHLDVTDSVIINNDKHNTFDGQQISSTIIITLTRAGTTTITKCKGVPGDFDDDKQLYKNSGYLLRVIKAMVKLCQ